MKFTFNKDNRLSHEEKELYELCSLAGVKFDVNIFKIILEMLKLDISPIAVADLLKSISKIKIAQKNTGE